LHGTLKRDCLRPNVPLSLEDARQLVASFVEHYNHVRLHSGHRRDAVVRLRRARQQARWP
jgi:hypothetical protein